ncbi:MAG: hypothetical protein PHZ03_05660 [Syntrophomonas sp.]|nr:hypothetical protein [Syntrophomonas sp.]
MTAAIISVSSWFSTGLLELLRFISATASSCLIPSIPELVVAEQEKPVKLKIPIPAAGQSLALDTKLALGRHTLLIKRIERLNNSLRIYLDSQSPAGWKLSWFYLEEWESAWSSRVLSYCGQRDEITRKIQYFEVDLDELKRQENYVVLMLKNPDSIVQGPWEFNIDKSKIMSNVTFSP